MRADVYKTTNSPTLQAFFPLSFLFFLTSPTLARHLMWLSSCLPTSTIYRSPNLVLPSLVSDHHGGAEHCTHLTILAYTPCAIAGLAKEPVPSRHNNSRTTTYGWDCLVWLT